MTPTDPRVTITPLTQEDAQAIVDWTYEPPYDFYNARADHRHPDDLLDAARRSDRYFAARDGAGELVCYFGFSDDRDAVGIGIGVRPDLTGRGLGLGLLEQGLEFARARFTSARFRLYVAAFNERAIAVYERAGFVQTRSLSREIKGSAVTFVEMELPA